MALQVIDQLLSSLDRRPPQGTNSWEQIIGDRTAESMKAETACKFNLDKQNSNANKRLLYLQTLFNQISPSSNEEKSESKEADIFEPIDNILDITRGESKAIDNKAGVYAVSSQADMSLDCKFKLKSGGKWYYEVELVEDPQSYKDINIGFANSDHSARSEIGHDANSYGYNGVKNSLYHMNTDYGKCKWKEGDVLGFALDLSENKIEFYLNGESQGIAFENIDYTEYLSAGFTLQKGEYGILIVDETKLKEKKPDGYSCIDIDNDAKQEDIWTIDGDIKVEKDENGIKLTSCAGFPTALLKAVQFTEGNKYYFEFVLGGGGCMQLGFADSSFKADSRRGEGIGDDNHSWGCDLLRNRRWGIFGSRYCNANWTKGDIIGCILDLDNCSISYTLNGKDLGVAFDKIDVNKGLYPAISVRNIEARNKLIEIYQKQRNTSDENDEEVVMPPAINYFNLIFAETECKYIANGCCAMTQHIAFKAMDICNELNEYSYSQYKDDYSFMDTVIKLSRDEEFDEIIGAVNADTLVVIDFWASWCGPCIYIAPHYHEISNEFKDVVFLKADVDVLKKLSQEKDVRCMPTFKFFKNGEEVHKIEGADKSAIVDAVKKYSQKDEKE